MDSVGSNVTHMDATGAKKVLGKAVVEGQAIIVVGCGADPAASRRKLQKFDRASKRNGKRSAAPDSSMEVDVEAEAESPPATPRPEPMQEEAPRSPFMRAVAGASHAASALTRAASGARNRVASMALGVSRAVPSPARTRSRR